MYYVLVVDDKEIFLRSIIRMPYFQQGSPFSILHTARNGVEALEYLQNNAVDVTLTDIRMPLMDGIELLKRIRLGQLCRCTVLLSEFAEFSYAKEGIINGAFDYLVKPVDNATIQATFERIFDHLQRSETNLPSIPAALFDLTEILFNENSECLLEALTKLAPQIQKAKLSESELPMQFELLCNGIQNNLQKQLPYVTLYIPLKQIFHFSRNQKEISLDAYMDLFATRLLLLQRELKKFRLNSQHPLIQRLWHYTLEHIEESCRLQDMAERFYVNKNYLSTLFKKETGGSYKKFVIQFKIERAKMLIDDSNLKIYNIAEQLQFHDVEYFRRVFKAQVGIPPGKFHYPSYFGLDQ